MARPKKEIKELKAIRVNLRFTVDNYLKLLESAKTIGMSLPDYIRNRALKIPIRNQMVAPINRQLFIELCRIGNNINQLAKKSNSGIMNSAQIKTELKQLRLLLAELKKAILR